MVLEEAVAPSSDSFMEDAPPSDFDPYASNSSDQSTDLKPGEAINYSIDTTKLPHVWSLFGPRPLNKPMMDGLRDQILFATNLLQRRLRQDEVDALSYHYARGLRIGSIGIPAGVLAGAIAARRTTDKFGFPFWTPKENSSFDPNKFAVLRGQSARMMWHGLRFSAYGFLGLIFGSLFFSSYAISLDQAARATDPRLKDFMDSLRQRMKEGKSMQPLQRPPKQNNPITTQDGQMDAQVQRAQSTLQRTRSREPKPRGTDDDMSPTSGAWAADYSDKSTDTGLLSDAQMQSREQKQQADARSSPTESRSSTFDINKVTSQPQSFDDASPTSGSTSQNKYPTGSSWERIRKEAAAGQGSGRQQRSVVNEQRQGSTLGDSFSFSESMEDRQLAKSEAQRDFDARVEKERQGGDFSQGNSGRKW